MSRAPSSEPGSCGPFAQRNLPGPSEGLDQDIGVDGLDMWFDIGLIMFDDHV